MIEELEEKIKQLEGREENFKKLKREKDKIIKNYQSKIQAYDRVLLARHEDRPKGKDFIENIISQPIYLHGDRLFKDDKSIIGGIGYLEERPVTFIATSKGKCLEDNVECNFGMPRPEGYRKALRLMKQAEKFNRPVVIFIDTPGAYPGIDAEERGQGEAIARNMLEMGRLRTPIISVITGEGGSGGALALSVADRIMMMENSIFSILSPEGFATILWKDGSRHKEATEIMKLTAKDLYDYGIIDKIIDEDITFSLEGFQGNFDRLEEEIKKELNTLTRLKLDKLVKKRQDKYRKIGGGF